MRKGGRVRDREILEEMWREVREGGRRPSRLLKLGCRVSDVRLLGRERRGSVISLTSREVREVGRERGTVERASERECRLGGRGDVSRSIERSVRE